MAAGGRTGKVKAVCISEKKGEIKKEVGRVSVKKGWGIDGDAHAGKWHRQVSILAAEDIADMEKVLGRNLDRGVFAENIITEGLKTDGMPVGSILETEGGVVLELTQIGKECHSDCAIKRQTGKCVMPQKGLFFRVLEGGEIKAGDTIEFASLYNAAVLVVSTSCSMGTRTDEAGEAVMSILRGNGFRSEYKSVVPDDAGRIKAELLDLCNPERGFHLVLTSGGTGLSPADVTPEATLEVIERRADGICELMRLEGGRSNSNAYLSRGVAGARGRTLIVNLPGSTRGASESLRAIIPVLPHALKMLCGDSRH
ncbi:MAG TPA: molybdenum cofactor biosynthesis protein [Spirochaetaceae bacterium]|nr:molybdenum cofactor biosynthesis protein [Spirochaetaceae bacterium]